MLPVIVKAGGPQMCSTRASVDTFSFRLPIDPAREIATRWRGECAEADPPSTHTTPAIAIRHDHRLAQRVDAPGLGRRALMTEVCECSCARAQVSTRACPRVTPARWAGGSVDGAGRGGAGREPAEDGRERRELLGRQVGEEALVDRAKWVAWACRQRSSPAVESGAPRRRARRRHTAGGARARGARARRRSARSG